MLLLIRRSIFFIFVEMKGGVHHLLTTDYPHPEQTQAVEDKYAGTVMRFKIDVNKRGFMDHTEISQDFKKLLLNINDDAYKQLGGLNSGYATGRCYAANGYSSPCQMAVNTMSTLMMAANVSAIQDCRLPTMLINSVCCGAYVCGVIFMALLIERYTVAAILNLVVMSRVCCPSCWLVQDCHPNHLTTSCLMVQPTSVLARGISQFILL